MMDDKYQCGKDTASTVANIVQQNIKPHLMTVKGTDGSTPVEVLVLPNGKEGMTVMGVKEFTAPYLTKPAHRKGHASLTTLDSLIDHTNRFKDSDSAIFVKDTTDAPCITTVFDYHRAGADADPRFCGHKGTYEFPMSEEWKAWAKADSKPLDMVDFAEFLEDRIVDVMPMPLFLTDPDTSPETQSDRDLYDLITKINGKPCGPDKLAALSKEAKINEDSKAEQSYDPQSGRMNVRFRTEHNDDNGKPVQIPDMFLIAIPIFKNGPAYRILVRLRYRLKGGSIIWSVSRHRPELAQEHAIAEACERVKTETGLPVFFGTHE
jgi:uncharacterized protein YfdQ (DUF2303 family)